MTVIPQVTLSPLILISPTMEGQELGIDTNGIDLIYQASTTVQAVTVSIEGSNFTSLTPTLMAGYNKFTVSITGITPSSSVIQVLAVGTSYNPADPPMTGPYYATPTSSFGLVYTGLSGSLPVLNPPSGVRTYNGLNQAQLEWVLPTTPGLLGVRVQYSTDSTGVNVPYQQYGPLVTQITRAANNVTNSKTSTAVIGDQTTITTVDTTIPVSYSSVIFPQSIAGGANFFYAVLSTVVQDPITNTVYESNFNGPFQLGFVDLRQVNPYDYQYLQQKEDIASRLISSAMANYPQLDLTPRSELRDLHIDPISLELSQQSVREWFGRCSQSISAMATIDDYDGDGVSDPFNTSPFKSQIATAWNLSASNTQLLIDKQFDILGERSGITRGGATQSVVMMTLYTYSKPTTQVTFTQSAMTFSAAGNSQSPAVNFAAVGSAVVTLQSINAIYSSANNWWSVDVPAECTVTGSIGNVGAGAISQASGLPSGWLCINQGPATYGTDQQSNSSYAVMIKNRLVVGVDSGSRLGYLNTTLATPGVIGANVVAAGDVEMERDWLTQPTLAGGGKHIFGCVDIYVRGITDSQQADGQVFSWGNSSSTYRSFTSYTPLQISNKSLLAIKPASTLSGLIYTPIEIVATQGTNQIFFGVQTCKVDPTTNTMYLNPTELCYQLTNVGGANEQYQIFQLNGVNATNQMVINYLNPQAPNVSVVGWLRMQTPLRRYPTAQPVSTVYSVVGNGDSGTLSPLGVRLIHSQDPLLNGFSNKANDLVQIDTTANATYPNITPTVLSTMPGLAPGSRVPFAFVTNGPTIKPIDTDMQVSLDNQGRVYGINSVRSADLSTVYKINVDYAIIPTGIPSYSGNPSISSPQIAPTCNYNAYSIQWLPSGSIPLGQELLIGYNKYTLHEYCTLVTGESQTLTGSTPAPLANPGFIKNVWTPESYGYTVISMDSALASAFIPKQNRYIKVTYDNGSGPTVMVEGQDYTLTIDQNTYQAYVARILTGRIPDKSSVLVSYFYNEMFSVTTGYPGYIEQVANAIAQTKNAGGDVLIKQMMANAVDIILSVELNPNVTPVAMDGQIRTVLGVVLSNASSTVTQSEVIRQVKSIPGIANVIVPLTKLAKSDGSYDVGVIIPSGTTWIPITQDTTLGSLPFAANTWITSTATKVLPDQTIPSGGLPDAYVGMLYEGDQFRRASSIMDLVTNPPTSTTDLDGAFYIIGVGDQINSITPIPSVYEGCIIATFPSYLSNTTKSITPSGFSYKVTYQAWREGGYRDITLSSTEYLTLGSVTIDYITS